MHEIRAASCEFEVILKDWKLGGIFNFTQFSILCDMGFDHRVGLKIPNGSTVEYLKWS